jgi:hypothetical protein
VRSFAITFVIALTLSVLADANAQAQHAVSLPGQNPGAAPSGGTPQPSASPTEKDVEDDDTLYRAPTKDNLASGGMIRDEGAIHFKPRRKEKINEVDSLKNLQSSNTDPKFQGSLAISGVPSISNIASKSQQAPEISGVANEQGNESGDDRFAKKRMTFVPVKKDDQKKTHSEDSSPSPSPSPTASAAAKDSGASKK